MSANSANVYYDLTTHTVQIIDINILLTVDKYL